MTDPIHKLSADASLLSQHLARVAVGQVVTYAELSAIISKPVGGAFPALRTALHIVFRDHDMVFDCVRTIGFKRLGDSDIVKSGHHDAERIRRAARRAMLRQTKADFTKLSREEQARFTAQVSTMATIAMMTKPKNLEKLAATVTPQPKELPVRETLAMFQSAR